MRIQDRCRELVKKYQSTLFICHTLGTLGTMEYNILGKILKILFDLNVKVEIISVFNLGSEKSEYSFYINIFLALHFLS